MTRALSPGTLPTRPVQPAQPETLRQLIRDHNRCVTNLVNATAQGWYDNVCQQLADDLANAVRAIQDWHNTVEGRAWTVARETYNAQAQAFNAALDRNRQARRNQAAANAVRSAACPRCTATHRGEC